MKNSSNGNGKRNRKDFWCLFEEKCTSCIIDLLEPKEELLRKFEKCLDKFTFSEGIIKPESKPLTKTEILAVKQLCMYELRLKLKNDREVPISIPPILLQIISKMKRNRPLLVTLSHYKGPRKVLKNLKFI